MEGWPDENSDNEVKVPEFVKTYKAWIPQTAQEIEDRVRLIKTIKKYINSVRIFNG